jgi:nicotinamidase-related amidase
MLKDGSQQIFFYQNTGFTKSIESRKRKGDFDMGKKALINIDYTVDFVADDGALTCGKSAQRIEGFITSLTDSFIQNGDFVVFAVDIHKEHDPYHPESRLYPPHNIDGTEGRRLYGRLGELYERMKNKENVYYMDKTRYSAFAGTDLEMQLRSRGIDELHLCGVCTDICLLHTAVDAYNKGFTLVVYEKGTASFNEVGHHWALEHFQQALGAKVIE